ncbi:glycoside hydrolase family 70 protein [Lactobacillus corticis]|uniref:dextransucrase n=1 Tax=Lactobacillus corticis TaxID=2201249 RepID=A0A916QJE1_9LACO|nr:glycoside hydrolase family 70 protein [Lactobacillus corticis]GFZ26817.1 hypothetical protein LCB40_06970 [Lactobacillus corticis]
MKLKKIVAGCSAALLGLLIVTGAQNVSADSASSSNSSSSSTVKRSIRPNLPLRMNTAASNYFSYESWFEPKYYLNDKGEYVKNPVGKNDPGQKWFPLMAYTWPNKTIEADYIKYMVANGYSDSELGLTTEKVSGLNGSTSKETLDSFAKKLLMKYYKVGTDKLDSTIKSFVQNENYFSELPVESMSSYVPDNSGSIDNNQLLFVNNDNTSGANSSYRKITNNMDHEFLLGIDMDNSNPVVQAENLNWEYWLLHYGSIVHKNSKANFDGFRVDAASHVDLNSLAQVSNLMNQLYKTSKSDKNANSHLVYDESYVGQEPSILKKYGTQQIAMDGSLFYTFQNTLAKAPSKRTNLYTVATNSIVKRTSDTSSNKAQANWTFVNNHDQIKNVINQIIIDNHPGDRKIMSDDYKSEYATEAWNQYKKDRASKDKKYAQYNVPSQYALLLSNKDTIPTVYYGDLYDDFGSYMKTKTPYYTSIHALLNARKKYVAGGQTITKLNKAGDLIASVRYGKSVTSAKTKIKKKATTSRHSGMAVVVSNNPGLNSKKAKTYKINMGKAHAKQSYRYVLKTTSTGVTTKSKSTVKTDKKGILKLTIKGYSNSKVSGYLAVLVPRGAKSKQVATTKASSSKRSSKVTYRSNAALDSHVIYEGFSLFQNGGEYDTYTKIAKNAKTFAGLGITDFWMAPSYKSFGMSRYGEGYSVSDRYDLGDSAKNKYGTGKQLASAITALHKAGLKVQNDLVLNQMLGLSGVEAVTVDRINSHGQQLTVNGRTFKNALYFAYTKSSKSDKQYTYGGKYLGTLKSKYPKLFKSFKAGSVTVSAPSTSGTRIRTWSAKYENGTSTQNAGVNLAVTTSDGSYAELGDIIADSKLPDELTERVTATVVK